MRKLLIAAVIAVAAIGGYREASVHHIGAPPDPYGPCPAGSHYVSFWEPGTRTPIQGGVIHYLGATEIASCGASVTITGQG